MKIQFLCFVLLLTMLVPAHAFTYSNTPASTVYPPDTIEQDPNVPITPNIYGPATPLSKAPPQGTIVTPDENNKTNYQLVHPATQQ